MAGVKWIKLATDIFEDEKMLLIESMPDAYAIMTVWVKLLCLAGKQNNGGVLAVHGIPYTDEMLSTIFRMPVNTVRLAIDIFTKFGMVETVEDVMVIPNWNKHQSLDAYESKLKRDREYVRKRREEQKKVAASVSNENVRRLSDDMSADCQTTVVSQNRRDKKRLEEEQINISVSDHSSFFKSEETNRAFDDYISMRKQDGAFGDVQIRAAANRAIELSGGDDAKATKMIVNSTIRGWKSIFPLPEEVKRQNKNAFHNLDERSDDLDQFVLSSMKERIGQ